MSVIFHIATRAEWQRAQADGAYKADTLATEGFVHCSTPAQVLATANAFFRGRDDLVLLAIHPARLGVEIEYEGAPGGEQFPHVYGQIELDAVVRAVPFPPEPDGTFRLPAGV